MGAASLQSSSKNVSMSLIKQNPVFTEFDNKLKLLSFSLSSDTQQVFLFVCWLTTNFQQLCCFKNGGLTKLQQKMSGGFPHSA